MQEGPPIRKLKGMEIPETTVWNPGELSEIREETPSGEEKCGTAGPLPHWMGVKEPAFHGGSKTPGPLPSTVPMPKRTLSVQRSSPPPPIHTVPIIEKRNEADGLENEPPAGGTPTEVVSAGTPPEDKREGHTGQPGALLPIDRLSLIHI